MVARYYSQKTIETDAVYPFFLMVPIEKHPHLGRYQQVDIKSAANREVFLVCYGSSYIIVYMLMRNIKFFFCFYCLHTNLLPI